MAKQQLMLVLSTLLVLCVEPSLSSDAPQEQGHSSVKAFFETAGGRHITFVGIDTRRYSPQRITGLICNTSTNVVGYWQWDPGGVVSPPPPSPDALTVPPSQCKSFQHACILKAINDTNDSPWKGFVEYTIDNPSDYPSNPDNTPKECPVPP